MDESEVPVDECLDPGLRLSADFVDFVNQHHHVHAAHQMDHTHTVEEAGLSPFWQKTIFVLFVAVLIIGFLVHYYVKNREEIGDITENSFSNAVYDVKSQAVSLQPSQQYVRQELPDYDQIIRPQMQLPSDLMDRPISQMTFTDLNLTSTDGTSHIYDVPRSPISEEAGDHQTVSGPSADLSASVDLNASSSENQVS
jgi:hypothetical protein